MTVPDEPTTPADRCPECAQPLAHDQRYCVVCGARRAALPARIAVALSDLADRPRPVTSPADAADAAVPASVASDRVGDLIPLARAAAVSILLMLGVGSVIGAATTPGGVTSLASTIVVALSPSSHPAPTRIAAVGPTTGGGSSSGGGGGGGGGGSAAAVTTQAQRTVTVSASSSAAQPTTSATTTAATTPATPSTSLPPIHHIWEIVLSDQGFAQSFGSTSSDPYLARTLADQGTVVGDYDAVSSSPLANEVALISGQGPTEQTLADCPQYADISPGAIARHSQVRGDGCLYPSSAQTLGSELQIQGLTWRAYIQGVGQKGQTSPATTTASTATTSASTTATTSTSTSTSLSSTTSTASTSSSTSPSPATGTTVVADTSTAAGCPHPADGAADPAGVVRGGDDYVTWKNPWVYFHSVLDTTTCAQNDVGLGSLADDLRTESTTPAFSYIAPDPCDDGSTSPCTPQAKDGMRQADRFLKTVVPEIERSPAYKADGLILITFDEAPQSGPNWSTASCCGQPTFPNLPPTTATGATGTTSATTTTLTSPITSTATTTTTGAPTTTGPSITTSCPTTATTPTTPTTPTTATAPTTSSTTTTTTSTDCAPVITGDPPGGGQVGLLMISPYVAADKTNEFDIYNHFSTLKTVAQLLGVTPLGYAAESGVPAFSPSLFLATKR